MNKAEKSALCSCPLFSGFEAGEIEAFLHGIGAYRESFPSGEEIRLEKDGTTRMGILLSGGLKILSPSDDTILNRLEPSSLFGVSCLYGEKSAETVIIASKASTVLFLSGEDSQVLWENRALRKNLISFLTDRIRFLNRKIASFTAHSSEEKLLCYLQQNADENGRITLTRSYSELARALHLGRASLYRAMEKLESRGVMTRDKKALLLLDPKDKIVL